MGQTIKQKIRLCV